MTVVAEVVCTATTNSKENAIAKKRQDDGSEVEAEDNDALAKAGAEIESTKENAIGEARSSVWRRSGESSQGR